MRVAQRPFNRRNDPFQRCSRNLGGRHSRSSTPSNLEFVITDLPSWWSSTVRTKEITPDEVHHSFVVPRGFRSARPSPPHSTQYTHPFSCPHPGVPHHQDHDHAHPTPLRRKSAPTYSSGACDSARCSSTLWCRLGYATGGECCGASSSELRIAAMQAGKRRQWRHTSRQQPNMTVVRGPIGDRRRRI